MRLQNLGYPDPASLPAIAGALTRAYLPHATAAQHLGLLGRIAAGLLRPRTRPRMSPTRPRPGKDPDRAH